MKNAGLNPAYDDLDKKIARILIQDSNLTHALIGEMVGLSSSAVNERIRKLKTTGKIKKLVSLISSEFLNLQICAFIFLDRPKNEKAFLEFIDNSFHVMECHRISGSYSYILKIRVYSLKILDKFLETALRPIIGDVKIAVQISTYTLKEESFIVD